MRKTGFREQLLVQIALLATAAFVLLPLWGLLRVALDGAIKSVPTQLTLLPDQPTLANFIRVWQTPSQTLTFAGLLKNSLVVAGGSALAAVVLGTTAAYAFARLRFPGRETGLFMILVGAFLPLVALLTPLYVLLEALHLRSAQAGLILVYTSFALPFCIWHMRAAFQSIPTELEEAAALDGATRGQTFWWISLPMTLPSIGVAAVLAFLAAYTEFAVGWLFVESSSTVTVAMALWGIRSLGSSPWSQVAAMALMMSLPVVIIFLVLQNTLFNRVIFGGSQD